MTVAAAEIPLVQASARRHARHQRSMTRHAKSLEAGRAADDGVRDQTRRIAAGDAQAFTEFYNRWFDRCLAHARRLTGRDEQFCLDVVQETMLRVIRHLKPMSDGAALTAWMKAALRCASLDLLRREVRRAQRERFPRDAAHDERPRTPADLCEMQERIEWLRRNLACLPPGAASALDLRFRLNMTLSRIGKALRLKSGAVDGRISRAIASLEQQATKDFDDE